MSCNTVTYVIFYSNMDLLTTNIASLAINKQEAKTPVRQRRNRRRGKDRRGVSDNPSTTYMYPEYHGRIVNEVQNMVFCNTITESYCTKEYDSNITGTFECNNNKCNGSRWSSKKISITIRMYENDMYNAEVYNQRCKVCGCLGIPQIDVDCYVERVTYRLKKWLGYDVTPPIWNGSTGKPHKSELCEGCKAGHCSSGEAYLGFV